MAKKDFLLKQAVTDTGTDPPLIQIQPVQQIVDLCRAMSLWPMTFGLACCAIEMMAVGMARFDIRSRGIPPVSQAVGSDDRCRNGFKEDGACRCPAV